MLACDCLGGGSGEESDVLSINADADDSDIEGPKEEKAQEAEEEESAAVSPTTQPPQEEPEEGKEPKKEEEEEEKEDQPRLELQQDIERSVSEILALSVPVEEPPPPPLLQPQPRAAPPVQARPQQRSAAVPSAPAASPAVVGAGAVGVAQPSAQQLELLELEMRARAIKALMKANDASKQALGP